MRTPVQLELRLYHEEIDLDGHVDARGIEYVGKATRDNTGRWSVMAKLSPWGPLCIVEVKVTPKEAS